MEDGEVVPKAEKQSLVDTMRKVLTPERFVEFQAGNIMMGLENVHDMNLVPENYGFTRDQIGPLFVPNDPVVRWAVDHIGDIWEISAGFTALRLGFVVVNEVLKKTTGKEIPDEACFWASLATTVTVKAIHSLGYISLFGIHDHMDNPVPEMLFGQGVAAVVLAASHYAAKYREPIKDLALRAGIRVAEGAKFTGRKFKEFDQKINALGRSDVAPDVVVNVNEQVKE